MEIKNSKVKVFSLEEISVMVLTKMKEAAEAFLAKKIKDAVVTVPGIVQFLELLVESYFTSMMPRGRQQRMQVLLLGWMLLGLSMNPEQQQLPV